MKQVSEWNIQISFVKNIVAPVLIVVLASLIVWRMDSLLLAVALGGVLATVMYSYLSALDQDYRSALDSIRRREVEREQLFQKIEFEKARFEIILSEIPEAISILEAPTGKMIISNPQMTKLWGVPQGETLESMDPKAFKIFDVNGHALGINDWSLWHVLTTGETRTRDLQIVRFDGQHRYITSTVAPIRDGQGKVLAAIAILVDNTVQKVARAALVDSEQRFRHLADALPQIVWTTDATGKIDYYNQQWVNYFGKDVDGSRLSWVKVIHPDDYELSQTKWKQCVETGEVYQMAYRLRDGDGQYRWFLTRGIPTFDDQGQVVRWFGTCTDIDQQKHLQMRLERAIAYRDEFLSVASHELKTPLTSLKLQLQMIKKRSSLHSSPMAEKMEKTLEQCLSQSSRLERLVDDLLDVSRIRAGRMQFQFERTDLVQLVRATIDRLQDHITMAGCKVQFRAPKTLDVFCDRFRMEQVVVNLITNACKYAAGTPLLIKIEADGPEAKLSVKDFGSGIAKDKISRIFEPFERAVGSNNISGLGLGLFICRQIVLAHQGQIGVESELGQYSVFTVQFPIHLKTNGTAEKPRALESLHNG